jgi:hypothetical protein
MATLSNEAPRLPGTDQRILVMGRTGSGKTHMGLFQLSVRDYTERPWVIMNSKNDADINAIDGAKELSLTAQVPTEPGIYIIRPRPDVDDAALLDFLWRVWEQENVGLFIDEGYMIPKNNTAFRAILTQGRSKHISMIINTQRPVYLDRFAISEADFYQVFHMNDREDRNTIGRFLPDVDLDRRLEQYHSLYYDVARDQLNEFKPAPSMSSIQTNFRTRLKTLETQRESIGLASRKARPL